MYIGGVDAKGLHHLAWEIVDNCVDEYLNGYVDQITVVLHKGHDSLTVSDNGRGIPVDVHPKHKKTGLELVLTVLHAGGKFGQDESGYHALAAGCTGSGRRWSTPCRRSWWRRSSGRGSSSAKSTRKVFRRTSWRRSARPAATAPSIYFEPDPTIFKVTHFDAGVLKSRLEDMSYVHSGLKITFKDESSRRDGRAVPPGRHPRVPRQAGGGGRQEAGDARRLRGQAGRGRQDGGGPPVD